VIDKQQNKILNKLSKQNRIDVYYQNYFIFKVDETGTHIAGAGFWGHCSKGCPGANASPAEEAVDEQAKLQEELKVRLISVVKTFRQ